MKRFKVEHNDYNIPTTYITLFNPPYEDENVISRTKWKLKDVKITEVVNYQGEEAIIPVAAFACDSCGHINKEFQEADIKQV